MGDIPSQYQTDGYRTVYGDGEARLAVAIAELLIKLGAGGGGGGGGITQAQVEAAIEAAQNINDILTVLGSPIPAGNNNIGDVDVASLPVAFNTGVASATTQRTVTASDSPEVAAIGARSDAAASSDTGTFSLLAFIKRLLSVKLPDAISGLIPVRSQLFDSASTVFASIKDASIQPLLSDTALVVASRDKVIIELSGSASTLNGDIIASTSVIGFKSFSLQLSGTWSASIQIQGSSDNFLNITEIITYQKLNSPIVSVGSSITQNGIYVGSINFKQIRVRITAYGSGTVNGVLLLDKDSKTFSGVSAITNSIAANVSGTVAVSGTVSHDAPANSVNPLIIGGWARSAWQAPVQDGDTTRGVYSLLGQLINKPFAPPEKEITGTITITGTGNTQLFAAATTEKNTITDLIISNASAVSTVVEIKDGTTVRMRVFVAAFDTKTVGLSIPWRGSLNTAVNAANLTDGATVYVTGQGYLVP